MNKPSVAVALGVGAGLIDIVPMIAMRSNVFAIASAFAHWLVLGVVITYFQADVKPWLKGLLLAEASAIPVALMVVPADPTALGPIVLMSAVLGLLVGFLSARLHKSGAVSAKEEPQE